MRILITGLSGMAAAHLVRHLRATHPDCEIHGLVRSTSKSNVLRTEEWNACTRHLGDLCDAASVAAAVKAADPDYAFHLGAQSFVASSWTAGESTLAVNVLGTFNLLNALRDRKHVRVVTAGSSEEYGLISETPIFETHAIRPRSPYAVAKCATTLLAYQFFQSWGLHVVAARAFNHGGPGRDSRFSEGTWARQIAEAEHGLCEPIIKHGDLSASRDLTDVRDTVRAYVLLAKHGVPGQVYNIASGEAYTMQQVLDMLIACSERPFKTELDPARLRPSDVPILLGNSDKLRACTGWVPQIPVRKMLKDLLDWHREQVASTANRSAA